MTILDRIIADTQALLERRQQDIRRSDLEDLPLFDYPVLPFAEPLRQSELAIIAEIKKASPSRGVIREDFEVGILAQHYEAGGAAALSVLTEPLHFQGSLGNLAQARQAVRLPLLRKDFIIDPYQLAEAKAYGADAVLLIAAVLERTQLHELHHAATELGLACLVEVYDISELDRLDFEQVKILGVNNRDLRTFQVDINHSLRVFARAPDHIIRVSESGLRTADDLAHLRRHNIDAVLIGETFMRADTPGDALRDLRQALARQLATTSSIH